MQTKNFLNANQKLALIQEQRQQNPRANAMSQAAVNFSNAQNNIQDKINRELSARENEIKNLTNNSKLLNNNNNSNNSNNFNKFGQESKAVNKKDFIATNKKEVRIYRLFN